MKLRLAFAGFRHGHIVEVHDLAGKRGDVTIVGAAEEHAPTRAELAEAGRVKITHDSYQRLWREVEFDVLAVGDYYGRRGEIIIRALSAGKHVLVDKPVCTRLSELDEIARLAREKKLSVGCQLSLRDSGNFIALRDAVRAGRIGDVHSIVFSGQHPLLRGRRPGWYFEAGKHGGTINDIAIHGLDIIPVLTGRKIAAVVAARAWNARMGDAPFFQDGAQLMLRLDNNGGVLGDVSYLTPDSFGYKTPPYWRFTLHGSDGLAETSAVADGVLLHLAGQNQPTHLPPAAVRRGGYFEDFLNEVGGRPAENVHSLTTAQVLESSRVTLLVQQAADENLRDVAV